MTHWSPMPATSEHMAAVARLYAPFVTDTTISFESEPPNATEIAQRFNALTEAGYPYLVVCDSAQLLGFAYAGPFRARAAYRNTVECSVYVAEQAQRQGVGRALLAALIDDCARRGFRQMIAVIAKDAAALQASVASQSLHSALGFVDAGLLHHVGHKFDRDIDILIMQRQL